MREGDRGKDYRDTPGEKGVDERGRQKEGLQRYPLGRRGWVREGDRGEGLQRYPWGEGGG